MVAAERRRIAPAPEEPQEVLAELAFFRAFARIVARTGGRLAPVHQRFARQLLAAEFKFQEFAFVIHRNAAVVQQVAVKALV